MRSPTSTTDRPFAGRDMGVIALLLALTFLLYGQTYGFDFINYDDPQYIYENEIVKRGLTLDGIRWAISALYFSNWHPLTWIANMLGVSLFGLHPGAHHMLNVSIHALNGIVLYFLLRRIFRSRWEPFIVAALFLIHPLHVESVAWIAERKDVLSATFFLLAVNAYITYGSKPGPRNYLFCLLYFVLGCATKPMVVTFPVVMLFLDYWPLQRVAPLRDNAVNFLRKLWLLLQEKIPFLLISLAVGLLTIRAQEGAISYALPFQERAVNAITTYVVYIRQLFFPLNLSPLYPYKPVDMVTDFLPALLVFTGITTAALALTRRMPYLLAGWAWYVVMLAPVIGFLQIGYHAHADRYTYLPYIGLFLIIACLLPKPGSARFKLAATLTSIVLIFYFFIAYLQIGYWKNSNMLFSRAVSLDQNNYGAHVNLAIDYTERQLYEQAEEHAKAAIAISQTMHFPYLQLGNISFLRGDLINAERYYLYALSRSAENPGILSNLGVLATRQGQKERAIMFFTDALKIDPEQQQASYNLQRLLSGNEEELRLSK